MKHISKAVAGSHYSEAVSNPVRSAGILTLAKISVWMAVPCIIILLTACGTSKHIQTQIVKDIQRDTIYLSTEKYDSIYIAQDRYIDRSRDTLYIKESNTEYRFKLLRDTIKEVRVDSIPHEVRITETIEVPRKLTLYDHATRATFWLLIGFLFLWLYRKFHKLEISKENFVLLYSLSNPHAEPVLSPSKDETHEDFL